MTVIPERRQERRAGPGEPVTPTARPTADTYTSATIETVLGVRPATLRKWVERGKVARVGRDLYDGDSVIAYWRERALAAAEADPDWLSDTAALAGS